MTTRYSQFGGGQRVEAVALIERMAWGDMDNAIRDVETMLRLALEATGDDFERLGGRARAGVRDRRLRRVLDPGRHGRGDVRSGQARLRRAAAHDARACVRRPFEGVPGPRPAGAPAVRRNPARTVRPPGAESDVAGRAATRPPRYLLAAVVRELASGVSVIEDTLMPAGDVEPQGAGGGGPWPRREDGGND